MANTMQQVTIEEIFMEDDATTTVETLVLIEAVNLFTVDDLGEFTPMFGPFFCGQIGETK